MQPNPRPPNFFPCSVCDESVHDDRLFCDSCEYHVIRLCLMNFIFIWSRNLLMTHMCSDGCYLNDFSTRSIYHVYALLYVPTYNHLMCPRPVDLILFQPFTQMQCSLPLFYPFNITMSSGTLPQDWVTANIALFSSGPINKFQAITTQLALC